MNAGLGVASSNSDDTLTSPSDRKREEVDPNIGSTKLVPVERKLEAKPLQQRFNVLRPLETQGVNEVRKEEGLPHFPQNSVLVEFYPDQEQKPAAEGSSNYEERGFFVLTPLEFDQTEVTLTVQIVVDEDDVSS